MAKLPPTKLLFAGVLAALADALGPTGRAAQSATFVPVADVFDRFDGDPEDAVNEHVAELQGATGTSVLVGFTADQVNPAQRSGSGRALATTVPLTVLVVRRRSERAGCDSARQDPVSATRRDAEALDDAMDAVLETVDTLSPDALRDVGIEHLLFTTSVGLVGASDWYGRALTFDLTRLPRRTWQSVTASTLS